MSTCCYVWSDAPLRWWPEAGCDVSTEDHVAANNGVGDASTGDVVCTGTGLAATGFACTGDCVGSG